ncbi:MAG: hypothetical protein ACE14P_08810 [Methanotrichaceae archaeon]
MKVKSVRKFNYADSSGATQNIDPGMVVDVPEGIAKNWISMGWAIEYKPPK